MNKYYIIDLFYKNFNLKILYIFIIILVIKNTRIILFLFTIN